MIGRQTFSEARLPLSNRLSMEFVSHLEPGRGVNPTRVA
jgi:hypothetical protein